MADIDPRLQQCLIDYAVLLRHAVCKEKNSRESEVLLNRIHELGYSVDVAVEVSVGYTPLVPEKTPEEFDRDFLKKMNVLTEGNS